MRHYTPKIKIYRDHDGFYRWRLLGANGKILADGGEGYVSKYSCEKAVDRFVQSAQDADIVETAEVPE